MLKIKHLLLASAVIATTATQASAAANESATTMDKQQLLSLFDQSQGQIASIIENVSAKVAEGPLTQALTQKLGVTNFQAASGAGALVAMAHQQLDKTNYQELSKLVPGIDKYTQMVPDKFAKSFANIQSVEKVFSSIGIDPALAGQFIQTALDFLRQKGATPNLLEKLQTIWAPKTKAAANAAGNK